MLPPKSNNPAQKQVDISTLKPLIDFLNSYHPVSRHTIRFLLQHTRQRILKKGEILQHAGTICTDVWFVMKGVLRGYIIDNGKEVTTWITIDGRLVSSIRSVFFQVPTQENIEALEDCVLIELPYSDLLKVYDAYPEFNMVTRKILEYYYAYAEYRAFICRLTKASDRYDCFIQQEGHLINRIPLMYIASYLNMSIETLSRIRKKYRSKKQVNGQ